MAYGLIITEPATAVVVKMDTETHDRFVHAMLELSTSGCITPIARTLIDSAQR